MKLSSSFKELFLRALEASKNAYALYSHFHVGAALLCDNEKIITGCNIENRSYGLSNCAERTALFKAVSEKLQPVVLALATPDADYPVAPCGACRQVISEFMSNDATIIFGSSLDTVIVTSVKELYPFDSLHELAQK